MLSTVIDDLLMLLVPIVFQLSAVFLLGLIAIPLLRSRRTGRFEWRIGKRFTADGSEPSMGGAVAALAFSVYYFPTVFIQAGKNSTGSLNSREGLIIAGIYVIIIVCAGAAEDWLKSFKGRPAGLPQFIKQLFIFSASLVLLLSLNMSGGRSSEVLLPFRLGFIKFGWLYYPLTAIAMTVVINIFKLHHCFGGREREQVGGLNEVSGALSLISVGICCELCGQWDGSLLANISAAVCIGMLIWTLSPSKLISGDSGAYFAGAAFAAAVVLSGLELLMLTAALPQAADVLVAFVHFLRFRIKRPENAVSKRSLAMLWRERGNSDYMIIVLFFVMSLIGGAASALFAQYARGFIW